ncbi:MAG: BMP family ABC transporter substrate-binding protein [Oscillospiraceae bacterium]|nr:BMP family ABC transporter substrate-binding protein [Oscillospiraceae bacterium]
MKKLLALVLCLALVAALFVGCQEESKDTAAIKVGLICIGDENDQGYTYNFIRGKDAATKALKEKGINVEWVVKWNVPEGDACEDANIELAEAGCKVIFNNSFGFEPYMLKVAPNYPEIQFVACTNKASRTDDLENTHNAFAAIYEGRYLAGVVAGMKLQQLIDDGTITDEQAVIGYVGAFPFEEIKSGYTAYFLGAKSVCPSVTMKVQFVNDWSNATLESNAASALCDMGCKLISQHADNSTPATMAQSKGAYFTSYNNDMISVAPEACLVGTRIDWSVYFCEAIEAVANGKNFDQDWCKGLADGAVVLTELNKDIIAPGTEEKLAEVEKGLKDGSIQVFDTKTFTVGGQELTQAFALDTDGDFAPDKEEAVFNGAFHESYYQSAPYFGIDIDGIELLN